MDESSSSSHSGLVTTSSSVANGHLYSRWHPIVFMFSEKLAFSCNKSCICRNLHCHPHYMVCPYRCPCSPTPLSLASPPWFSSSTTHLLMTPYLRCISNLPFLVCRPTTCCPRHPALKFPCLVSYTCMRKRQKVDWNVTHAQEKDRKLIEIGNFKKGS